MKNGNKVYKRKINKMKIQNPSKKLRIITMELEEHAEEKRKEILEKVKQQLMAKSVL